MKEWQSDERKFHRFLPNRPHSKTRRNLPPIGCYVLRGSNQLTSIHAQLTVLLWGVFVRNLGVFLSSLCHFFPFHTAGVVFFYNGFIFMYTGLSLFDCRHLIS